MREIKSGNQMLFLFHNTSLETTVSNMKFQKRLGYSQHILVYSTLCVTSGYTLVILVSEKKTLIHPAL